MICADEITIDTNDRLCTYQAGSIVCTCIITKAGLILFCYIIMCQIRIRSQIRSSFKSGSLHMPKPLGAIA